MHAEKMDDAMKEKENEEQENIFSRERVRSNVISTE